MQIPLQIVAAVDAAAPGSYCFIEIPSLREE
jgi:hypothetical protein